MIDPLYIAAACFAVVLVCGTVACLRKEAAPSPNRKRELDEARAENQEAKAIEAGRVLNEAAHGDGWENED